MYKQAVAVIVLVGLAAWTWADKPAACEEDVKGPLAGLPSPAGSHIAQIEALGDNQWLDLGPPAADPQWGAGRGRSWSSKMPYAADLQGAFLFGLGVHGFLKPDGRYMDDLFFYDLNAHRWICLYPGTDSKTFVERIRKGELQANDDGQLVDQAGRPVPYCGMGAHSYGSHTYDPDRKRHAYLGMPLGGIGHDQHTRGIAPFAEGYALLLEQTQGKSDRMQGTPFFYETTTGLYQRYPHDGKVPMTRRGAILEYLPGRKQLFHYFGGSRRATDFYDCGTYRWVESGATGTPPPGSDMASCYDSQRDRIYAGRDRSVTHPVVRRGEVPADHHFYIYDVKTNSWSNPPDKGTPPTLFGTNYVSMHYDSVNDRVVHFGGLMGRGRGSGPQVVSVFNPQTGAWEETLPISQDVPPRCCVHGFYSPEVNAHFLYLAPDSGLDRATMLVYRYKRTSE